MVIVIDGPAGSGKSSTAKAIANSLGLTYLDSGALYRTVTLHVIRSGNPEPFFDSMPFPNIDFSFVEGKIHVSLNGEDVTQAIRTPEVDAKVSAVSADAGVRDQVNRFLRNYVKSGAFIADGRDLGTVVFPNADLKIFLVADARVRAQRRHLERPDGQSVQDIQKELERRDELDKNRKVAPLKKADDAIEVDTSSMKFDEQVQYLEKLIQERVLNKHSKH